MNKLIELVSDFVREEEGLTIVEYAIAGAVIAATVATAFLTLGDNASTQITRLGAAVDLAGTN